MTLNDISNKLFNPKSRFFLRHPDWAAEIECEIFNADGRYFIGPVTITQMRHKTTVFFGKEKINLVDAVVEFEDGYSIRIMENA